MIPLSSSTYLGVDVLDGPSDVEGLLGDDPSRDVSREDPGPGLARLDAHVVAPRYRRTLRLWAEDAAERADLIGWLDARRGRALPFWLPSWDKDLTLGQAYETAHGITIQVLGSSYATGIFPAGPSRRHVVLRMPSGLLCYRRVESATEFEPGAGNEELDLDSALPEDVPAGTALSFLRYVRLDADEARLVFTPTGIAACELPIVELPEECPA